MVLRLPLPKSPRPPPRPPTPPARSPEKPPSPGVHPMEKVRELKWRLRLVLDLVSKDEWRKFDEPRYQSLLDEIERYIIELNRMNYLASEMGVRATDLGFYLRNFIAQRNKIGVFYITSIILLGLPPHLGR